jgi:hypothetical protein
VRVPFWYEPRQGFARAHRPQQLIRESRLLNLPQTPRICRWHHVGSGQDHPGKESNNGSKIRGPVYRYAWQEGPHEAAAAIEPRCRALALRWHRRTSREKRTVLVANEQVKGVGPAGLEPATNGL